MIDGKTAGSALPTATPEGCTADWGAALESGAEEGAGDSEAEEDGDSEAEEDGDSEAEEDGDSEAGDSEAEGDSATDAGDGGTETRPSSWITQSRGGLAGSRVARSRTTPEARDGCNDDSAIGNSIS